MDPLNENVVELLKASGDSLVVELWKNGERLALFIPFSLIMINNAVAQSSEVNDARPKRVSQLGEKCVDETKI